MKVLLLVANDVQRDGRVIRTATALVRRGHQVRVLGLGPAGLRREPGGFEVMLVPDRSESVKRLYPRVGSNPPGHRPVFAPSWATRAVRGHARAIGAGMQFRAIEQSMLVGLAETGDWGADVVHANDLNTLQPAATIAQVAGATLVYDSHEVWSELGGYPGWYRGLMRRYERRLLRRHLPRLIVVSPGMAEWFVRVQGTAPEAVVMNAVSPDSCERPRLRQQVGRPPVFLYQGVLLPGRGLEEVLDAFRTLRGMARLAVRGFGPLLSRVANESQLIADGVLEVLTPVSQREVVRAAAEAADVGIIPFVDQTFNNQIALPNKLFEYAEAGLGVLSSDLPEVRRLVGGSAAVSFLPSVTPAAIANAIRGLVDSGRIEQMKRATTALVSTDGPLAWASSEQRLNAVYERIGAERGHGR